MDLNELRKLPLPKLRDRAKEAAKLEDVMEMNKEALVEAIAKAEKISYEAPDKDHNIIRSVKAEISALRKQVEELLSSGDHAKIERLRKKIKIQKRLTRTLAREAAASKAAEAAKPAPEPESPPKAAEPESAPPAPESTPPPESAPPASS